MMLYLLLALVIIIFLFFYIPIQISFFYSRVDGNDDIKIVVGLLGGLLKFNLRIPVFRVGRKKGTMIPTLEYAHEVHTGTRKTEKPFYQVKESLEIPTELFTKIQRTLSKAQRFYARYGKWLTAFYDTVKIQSFSWESELGFSNPALTGILIGLAWQIKGGIIGLLCAKIHGAPKHEYKINVKANFNQQILSTHLKCIFTMQVGHIIFKRLSYFISK